MACAHVQPATVKAHAPVMSRLLTSGFGRCPEWTYGQREAEAGSLPRFGGDMISGFLLALAVTRSAGPTLPEEPTDGQRTRYAAGSCLYGDYVTNPVRDAHVVLGPNEIEIVYDGEVRARADYTLSADNIIRFAGGDVRFELSCIIGGPAWLKETTGDRQKVHSIYWRDPSNAEGDADGSR